MPFLAAVSAGCSSFASEWDLSEDARSELRPDAADWSCVSDDARPTPIVSADPRPLIFPLRALDYVTGEIPVDLQVLACHRGDVQCTSPVGPAIGPAENGVVEVEVALGFNGYLEVRAAGMVPMLYFFPDALSPELVEQIQEVPLGLLSLDSLGAFGASSQSGLDLALGVVSMNAFDCQGPNAKGVRLESNAEGLPFAFVDGLPVPFLNTTSEEGSAGFANVPPGLVVIKGYNEESELVGLETVLVRSQWVTVGSLMPQFAQ
jgi:hypothetical protein